MLLNGMKETSQDVIEFPEFFSNALRVILEHLYTKKVNLKIEIIVEAFFQSADSFLLEQLKLEIIEFFTNNYLKNNEKNQK